MLLRRCCIIGPRFSRSPSILVSGSLLVLLLFGLARGAFAWDKPAGSAAVDSKSRAPDFDPGVLVGQVATPDGKPVAGAKVRLWGTTQRRAETDGEGRFRFESLQPGHFGIFATKGNLVSSPVKFDGRRVSGFKTGKFAPVKLTVSEGKGIKVLVTAAATGKPLEGVHVRLLYLSRREQKTGKDGVATLDGLVPGQWQLTAELPGYTVAVRGVEITAANAVTRLEIALGAGGVVRGIVTDQDGKPVEGAQVSCWVEGEGRGYGDVSDKTDSHGAFRCESVALNSGIRVSVDKDHYLPYLKSVGLSPERREVEIAIKIKRRPPSGSIEGFVRDEKGKPIAGASVESHGNRSDQVRKTTSDRSGHYVLDDLIESWGGYDVIVRVAGRAPTSENVKPGTKEKPAHFDFALEPGHFLHGRIVGENGKPIGGVQVSVAQDVSGMVDPTQSDEEGRFEMDGLPANARFAFWKQGYSHLWKVLLRLDGAGTTTVVLTPMAVIRGRVVDSKSKQPLEHFQVWINFARVRGGTFQWTINGNYSYPGKEIESKEGTFTIDELMNGVPAEVGVTAVGYSRVILPLFIAKPADEMKPVQVALVRLDPSQLASVSGRVADHSGRGVSGANLRLIVFYGDNDRRFGWYQIKNNQLGASTDCDQFLQAISDSEGRFEFKNVLPGKHWHLAYWGVHVPQGQKRGDGLTQAGRAETVTVTLPNPARILVTIDRAKYAEATQLNTVLKGRWPESGQLAINAGQTTLEIGDLAPGTYNVSVLGKPVQVKSPGGTYYTTPTLANRTVLLKAGETQSVQF